MPVQTTKEKVLKAIRELPDEIEIEDAMERLYFLYKIEKGLQQANSGQKISHEEAKKRLQKWLE
jgi:predicted transcriptional regulator